MKRKVIESGLFLMFLLLLTGCKKEDLKQCWTNDHCYEAVLSPVSWYEAKAACENLGGYLVTITSEQENEFVYNLVKSNTFWYLDSWGNGLGPWIGGYQENGAQEPGGGWRWVTNEPFSYSNWEADQPDNVHGATLDQNCLRFFKKSGLIGDHWDDSEGINPVEHRRGYICEYE
jgi:hypothetical protein